MFHGARKWLGIHHVIRISSTPKGLYIERFSYGIKRAGSSGSEHLILGDLPDGRDRLQIASPKIVIGTGMMRGMTCYYSPNSALFYTISQYEYIHLELARSTFSTRVHLFLAEDVTRLAQLSGFDRNNDKQHPDPNRQNLEWHHHYLVFYNSPLIFQE